ncbi:MAG: CerR family C-terminal domain-containing protein [Pirellulales bacterium]|nr:CerR family C-terminal domain-containing protein [Pirellulales bacterium]
MSEVCARSKILEAAGEVFAEKGFKAATIREICTNAGVNLASVNYYYGDKEQLYLEAVKLSHPGRLGEGETALPEDIPVAEKLRVFVRGLLDRLAKDNDSSWQVRLFRREIIQPTPFCRETLEEFFRSRFSVLEKLVEEILPPGSPAWQRRQICFSIIGQCVYFRAAKNVVSMVIGDDEYDSHYNTENLTEHILRFSLCSLGLQKPFSLEDRPLEDRFDAEIGA